jgi:hypothetical protein
MELVTGDHTTGGDRLVAEDSTQSLAQFGQLMIKEFAFILTPNEGKLRNMLTKVEFELTPQSLTAANV